MSVCDPVGGMHALWRPMLPDQLFLPEPPAGVDVPPDPDYLAAWDDALGRHAHELAAIIVEPVVQGAGGMRFHHPGYLRGLRELADRHGVLLIFDEIATGFGRTGTLFAADRAGVSPDICCLGKAMTGGYLSMAATLCTAEVAEQVSRGSVLAHGPTFMANPLAAAVSLASIRLLLAGDWAGAVARIGDGLAAGLAPLAGLPGVREVRVLGAIGVVQLDRPVQLAAATAAAVEHGVWLRPFRDLVYAMPPYLCDATEVAEIAAGMRAAVQASLP
jgi:adenosylmethionine-8-amino-7-oxononanoate aminotransferase